MSKKTIRQELSETAQIGVIGGGVFNQQEEVVGQNHQAGFAAGDPFTQAHALSATRAVLVDFSHENAFAAQIVACFYSSIQLFCLSPLSPLCARQPAFPKKQ